MKKRILSFIMAAMMVVMMLPALVGAEEAAAAVEVATLEALQEAIADGKTEITLTKSITVSEGDVVIEAAKEVNITTAAIDAFTVTGGKLTLGKNINIAGTSSAVIFVDGGELVVDGADIVATGSRYTAVAIYTGKMTVKSGSISRTGAPYVTIDILDEYGEAKTGGQFVMEGGRIYNELDSAIGAEGKDTLATIKGGVVENNATDVKAPAYALRGGKVVVEGGTIAALNENPGSYALVAGTGGTVEVKGGTVSGSLGSVLAHESETAKAIISGGVITDAVASIENANLTISGGRFTVAPDPNYVAADKIYAENGKVICRAHKADNSETLYFDFGHALLCNDCGTLYGNQPHSYSVYVREGYKNVAKCDDPNCRFDDVEALTAGQKAVDNIKAYLKTLSVRKFAVAIDCDEDAVVITNNTSEKKIIEDLGDSALYNFMADVKYSFEAAEGYEIVAVYVDGVEVDADDVLIYQIKNNHVIKVVTEEIVVEETAEEVVEAETAVAETVEA